MAVSLTFAKKKKIIVPNSIMQVVWVGDWIRSLAFTSRSILSQFRGQKPGARWGKKPQILMSVLVGLWVHGSDPSIPPKGVRDPPAPSSLCREMPLGGLEDKMWGSSAQPQPAKLVRGTPGLG